MGRNYQCVAGALRGLADQSSEISCDVRNSAVLTEQRNLIERIKAKHEEHFDARDVTAEWRVTRTG